MKTLNKTTIGFAGSATLALALFLGSPTQATAGGTDITHYSILANMTNNGVEPGAKGAVGATQKTQGHADNQTLTIALSGLDTNMTFELVAVYDTDTNFVDVGSFTPDAHGKALFDYRSLGNGHGGGKKSSALPGELNPVSLIREVDIVDTNMQVVLSADLTSPKKLGYLIKRNLSNGSVDGSLMIQANSEKTHFRLLSTGLAPNTDYQLVFNGEVVQTNTSNNKGRLDIHQLTDTPPYILDVRSIELWDGSSNVVLQTELP